MTDHRIGTREEWLEARLKLLEAEKELTRRNDDLAQQRRELPWVRIDKDYRFDTEHGDATPRRPVPRPVAVARLPLHVRPRLGRRLSELLGGRRRLRRDASPSPEPRRRVHRRSPARRWRSCSPIASGWAGAFRGCRPDASDFNYDFHVTFDRGNRRRSNTTRRSKRSSSRNVAGGSRDWPGKGRA